MQGNASEAPGRDLHALQGCASGALALAGVLLMLQAHVPKAPGALSALQGCTFAGMDALGGEGLMLEYLLYSWHTGVPLW